MTLDGDCSGTARGRKPLRICVFCGSSPGHDPAFAAAAHELGAEIGRAGWTLVYGGGARGLMGELASAAAAAGAPIIGVRPDSLRHIEMPRSEGLEIEFVADLFERKRRMIELSDAYVTLPGGLGTLDEFLEVITTAQLGLHGKPSVLINIAGFFDPLLAAFAAIRDQGFIYGKLERLYHLATSAEEAIWLIRASAPALPAAASD